MVRPASIRLWALLALSYLAFTACGGTSTPTSSASPSGQAKQSIPPTSASPTEQTTTPAVAAGVAGTWNGVWRSTSSPGATGTFQMTFAQAGQSLSGPIEITGTPCITSGTITGTLSGTRITFGAVKGQNTVSYDGTWSGNVMSGTYSAPSAACGNGTGNWQAARTP
jgi:hypothetical protein